MKAQEYTKRNQLHSLPKNPCRRNRKSKESIASQKQSKPKKSHQFSQLRKDEYFPSPHSQQKKKKKSDKQALGCQEVTPHFKLPFQNLRQILSDDQLTSANHNKSQKEIKSSHFQSQTILGRQLSNRHLSKQNRVVSVAKTNRSQIDPYSQIYNEYYMLTDKKGSLISDVDAQSKGSSRAMRAKKRALSQVTLCSQKSKKTSTGNSNKKRANACNRGGKQSGCESTIDISDKTRRKISKRLR